MSPRSPSQEAVSQRAFREYLRVFGRQPRVLDLVRVYMELKDVFDDGVVPEDLYMRFRRALVQAEMDTDDEPSLLAIADQGSRIMTNLRLLNSRGMLSNMRWRQVTEDYSILLRTLVASRGLYWAPRPLPGRDGVRWIRLRNASPRQAEMEQIRREDPTLFQRIHESKEQRQAIDAAIGRKIIGTGQIPARQRIRGRWMLVGIDPALVPDKVEVRGKLIPGVEAMRFLDDPSVVSALPDEAVDVYKDDGKTVSRQQFVDEVDKENDAHGKLMNVNAFFEWGPRGGKPKYKDPDLIRRVSREDFVAAFGENPDPDDYVSITDDPRKETALTKIYPVKEYRGKQIITAGRFKGVYVSDLVNRTGRLIEGSITYYDPDTGNLVRREVRKPDGSVDVRKITEPYVTVDRGRLMLTLARGDGYATILRNAVRNLSKLVPSIKYEEGTGLTVFTFDPKDFGSIRDAIGAMALSNAASRKLQNYFDQLTKAERATEDRNLRKYTGERLGFRVSMRKQVSQAVAWLDANDNTGICALDTGVGKTAAAIATMQNLLRKGLGDEGNGKFLFVCKRALKGNFPKEAEKFLSKEDAKNLVDMTERITYGEFNRRQRGTDKSPPTDPGFADDFIAIFFDEAHEKLKSKSQASYKAVSECKAKRKILLTASPMVRSPREVFTLASVAKGVDLNTPEGRKEDRKFMERFAETVGGRTVGIKRVGTSRDTYKIYVRREEFEGRTPVPYDEWPGEVDVAASRDFNTWIKTNMFYASKRDVLDENGEKLKDLNVVPPVAVTMPPEIETVYRQTMNDLVKALRKVTSKNYGGNFALAVESAKVSLRPLLAKLTKLSDVPDEVIPGVGNPKIDQAKSIVEQVSGRTILFTDSPSMAEQAQAEMVKAFPGKGHAVAYSDAIVVTKATGEVIRYTPRRYPDPSRPQRRGEGSIMEVVDGKVSVRKNDDPNRKGFAVAKKDDWSVIVLQKYIQTDPTIATLVLTKSYSVGQNLQAFSNVIHLDRDEWSNETMKQRSARAWRAGQSEIVNEYTLDIVYGDVVSDDDADKTLDEIRALIQGMDDDLFNEVVVDSQVERIGEEWDEIKKQRSMLHKIDRQMMERSLSPYANHLGRQE